MGKMPVTLYVLVAFTLNDRNIRNETSDIVWKERIIRHWNKLQSKKRPNWNGMRLGGKSARGACVKDAVNVDEIEHCCALQITSNT